jgi:hypothetical protein
MRSISGERPEVLDFDRDEQGDPAAERSIFEEQFHTRCHEALKGCRLSHP